MKEKIYEHLITKKKYNTLKLKYDVKCEELEHKVIELSVEKRVKNKQLDLLNEKLKYLIEQNIELNEKLLKARKELRELKKKL